MARRKDTLCIAAAWLILGLTAATAHAQTATVSGFITDASDGQPMPGATVALYEAPDGARAATPSYGGAADGDGLYLITGIEPGRYVVEATFVGYVPHTDTLILSGGQVRTFSVALRPDVGALDEVVVESERTTGAARVTAGQQTITPEEVELVPSPDISADLVSYLTTLPGIITTGDRGGQLFVRGGEATQNLVLLDGMVVYQPFHLLGFFSAFPAEIIQQADFFAGGFGAKYGGRLSSVLDVASRPGNNRRFAGTATVSPFSMAARLEGPLLPGRFSFLASVRESLVEQAAAPIVGQDLPFRFGDAFARISGQLSSSSRLSIVGLRSHDRGTVGENVGGAAPEEIRWTNTGMGVRYLFLPTFLPMSLDINTAYSALESEQGPPGEPVRTSQINNVRFTVDAGFFVGRVNSHAGWEINHFEISNTLGGLFQNVEGSGVSPTSLGVYLEQEYDFGDLRVRPGVRLQFYNVRFDPYPEPRLRVVWDRGIHHVSGAAGVYHQEITGLSDRRDVANVFTVWTNIPRKRRGDDVREGRVGRAYHALLGYRSTPAPWVEFSVEGFYKQMTNLFVGEWTPFPRLSTRLQPAEGVARGVEARAEFRLDPVYAYVNYGLSSTRYAATDPNIELIYGVERFTYRPPHDRRHQVNALVSTALLGFDWSVRWEFGSGFPFSRVLGFDGWALVDDVKTAFEMAGFRRVQYDLPYRGTLPTYHRLDFSVERAFRVPGAEIAVQGSVINVYDRRNLFYLDVFTLNRVDQLPIIPSLGLKVTVE